MTSGQRSSITMQERKRHRLEGVIPDLIKKAVELGVEKAQEAPDSLKQFVEGRKLPKEIASYLYQQVDETKNGMLRVVGSEVRDFLEHANLAGELQRVLTTLQFEINTTIRFKPNREGNEPRERNAKPEVKTDLFVRRREDRKERRRNRE